MCLVITLRRNTFAAAFALSVILTACGGSGSGDLAGPPGDGNPDIVDTLVLSLDSAQVAIGDTLRLSAVATDAQGQPVPGIVFTWTSSNPAVAMVSDGLVTAIGEGEAEIAVEMAGGPQAASTSSGRLALATSQPQPGKRNRAKVIVVKPSACEGALGVNTWDAIFELSYQATGSHLEENFSVAQGSSATARLTRAGGDGKQTHWFGEVKGTGRIDNLSTHPDNRAPGGVYKLTEKGNGPLENVTPTTAHLIILVDNAGTCRFDLTYTERMTWTATRTYIGSDTQTGFFGSATVVSELGKKPAGAWAFGATRTLPAQKDLSDPELPNLPHTAYYPASAVAVMILESSPNTAGSATFSYGLTAH